MENANYQYYPGRWSISDRHIPINYSVQFKLNHGFKKIVRYTLFVWWRSLFSIVTVSLHVIKCKIISENFDNNLWYWIDLTFFYEMRSQVENVIIKFPSESEIN